MGPDASVFYRICWFLGQLVLWCTCTVHVIRRRTGWRDGPFVFAITHLSHIEPLVVSSVTRRPIDYIARKEFYRKTFIGSCLRGLQSIYVNRQGVPVTTVRTALKRLAAGRVVGIFPEGGVSRGQASVCRGGPMRFGATLLACRAQVPLVPVVVLGTHRMKQMRFWMPAKWGEVWIAFGKPILPPTNIGNTIAERRVAYRQLGEQLSVAYQSLFAELCATYRLSPDIETGATYAEEDTASRGVDQHPLHGATPMASDARTERDGELTNGKIRMKSHSQTATPSQTMPVRTTSPFSISTLESVDPTGGTMVDNSTIAIGR